MPNTTVRAAAEGMPSINRRRAILGAGATAAALAEASLPAEPATADAELIRLGQELERELALLPELAAAAHRLYPHGYNHADEVDQAAWMAKTEECGYSAAYDVWGDCDDRIRALVEQIEPIPATTLAGLVAKANALLFSGIMWEDDQGESDAALAFKTLIAEMKRMPMGRARPAKW